MGLLIKGGRALETLHKLDTVVLDKTGTLTEGRPRITEASIADDALRLAAAAERRSEHPLAHAVVAYAEQRALQIRDAEEFRSITGRGLSARVEGHTVLVGNEALMNESGVAITAQASGVFVAVDGKFAGSLTVSDSIRVEIGRAHV